MFYLVLNATRDNLWKLTKRLNLEAEQSGTNIYDDQGKTFRLGEKWKSDNVFSKCLHSANAQIGLHVCLEISELFFAS